jgi:quaternary ammonium compound-resistance protein SugE
MFRVLPGRADLLEFDAQSRFLPRGRPRARLFIGDGPILMGVHPMSWFLLFIAGLLEVAWAAGLKSSEGFTRLGPSVFTIITALGSFILLAMAMKQLPLGTAYAVWTGIGAVGAFVFGIVFMGEAVSAARIFSAVLIVAGLIGLKMSSGH